MIFILFGLTDPLGQKDYEFVADILSFSFQANHTGFLFLKIPPNILLLFKSINYPGRKAFLFSTCLEKLPHLNKN